MLFYIQWNFRIKRKNRLSSLIPCFTQLLNILCKMHKSTFPGPAWIREYMGFVCCWAALITEESFLPMSSDMFHLIISHILTSFRYTETTVQLRFWTKFIYFMQCRNENMEIFCASRNIQLYLDFTTPFSSCLSVFL